MIAREGSADVPEYLWRDQSHEPSGHNNQNHESVAPELEITPVKRVDFLRDALRRDFGLSLCDEGFHRTTSCKLCFPASRVRAADSIPSPRFLVTITSVTSTCLLTRRRLVLSVCPRCVRGGV